MLPMIVTVNLAKGAIAMSRKRVIVKRLDPELRGDGTQTLGYRQYHQIYAVPWAD
jgi:magnesium-transporting ATPase (P-type)